MNICFTSYRPFPDGPVKQPFLESDPANIAYALGGSYLSFYTLKKLSNTRLREILRLYDLVLVALDIEAIELVARIVESCQGRVATYSEGHLTDYQRLSPAEQVLLLRALDSAQINFIYWERYVPFYRALTSVPVEYLPYPYLLKEVQRHQVPLEQRPLLVALPTGLAGSTRNGLATLALAKRLLQANLVDELVCWLDRDAFEQDAQAINYFLFSAPYEQPTRQGKLNWRKLLLASRIDYRPLLKLKARWRKAEPSASLSSTLKIRNLSLYHRQRWSTYITQLARARILIDLNDRATVGRNALDCAALGIACVSTNCSDMQARLFPGTTLENSWDIDAAFNICQHLLTDLAFYQRVTSYAAKAVQQFDVHSFRQRFTSLCARYPQLSNFAVSCEASLSLR